MKRFLYRLANLHDIVYKIGLIFLFFIVILLLFPRQGRFKYEFQKGKRWQNKDLVAPFDFGIAKTTEELKSEKEEILSNIIPYYRWSDNVRNEAKKSFNNDFDAQIHKLQRVISEQEIFQLKQLGNIVLDSLYSVGFIETTGREKHIYIKLVRDNIENEANVYQFIDVTRLSAFARNINSIYLKNNKDLSIDTSILIGTIQQVVRPNIVYDNVFTQKITDNSLQQISPSKGLIHKGDLIVAKNDLITPEKYQILSSLRSEYESQSLYLFSFEALITGQSIIILMAIMVLVIFLITFRADIFRQNKNVIFLFLITILAIISARVALGVESLNIYIVPFCILPIIVRIFFDTRLALFVHLITILMIGYLVPDSYEFVFLQIVAGIIAIVTVNNLRNRSQLFLSALIIFLVYSITFSGLTLVREGSFSSLRWSSFIWFGMNAFGVLLSYPLMFIFEKIFDFASDVTLLELSDTNNKLLRELAEKAPGTFQHSLQVANLAEEAIFQIGGNSLLVRTGALYHDIGKMDMPMYFIENQSTGINPHDELNFEESARIIISHVSKGIEKAKANKLPEQIIDFIRTHHGNSVVQYFYQSFLKDYPKEMIDKEAFTYPGPIPYSKETAVLMMADCIEAASRSLKVTTPESIDNLVETIINHQMASGQFMNADITLKDITRIKKIFKKRMINAHHLRIEYPS